MSWDGSGNFTRTNGTQTGSSTWANARDAGNNITASQHDTHDQDLATGIGACLTKNGETKPTADFKPNADASYSLGSSALRWLNIFLSGFLGDSNGNELLKFGSTASAVNEVTVTNAATGNRPRVSASGGDTNVGLALRPQGTGSGASVIVEDGNGNEVLIAGVATASAVNEVTVTNAATGSAPSVAATGGDTNVDLQLNAKGTGYVKATGNSITATLGKQPTRTVYTSGSGTYTTPTGATRIDVQIVGGGAGGGAATTNNGTAGNNTTFGTAMLTAGGGSLGGGAGGAGGAGGTASGGDINIPGGSGGPGIANGGGSAIALVGGCGGNSFFGGGGAGGAANSAGGNGATNSGAGGGGGGNNGATTSGGGGGAGGYVRKLITSPSATYAYAVGAAANGGAAGAFAGGNGAAGIIIIDEYYN